MNREEFEAVLALDGRFELRTQFVRGHRGKGRYWAALVYKPTPKSFIGTHSYTFAHSLEQAILNLAKQYANH